MAKKSNLFDHYYKKKQENEPKQSKNLDLIEKVLIVLSLGIYFLLFPPFFKNLTLAGHDVGSHLTYLRIFTDALSQGQFPVRWVEWVVGGQNQPLFSFYQPLLYYIAQIPHFLGSDILNSLEQTVLFLWLFSGFLTFLFVRNLTKSTLAATVSSALYIFAPYHILDIFVRTAYPESIALAFAPGLFYSLERYFATEKRYYLSLLALFFFSVFVSHPPTLIMFAFPFGAYFLYLLFKDYKNGLKERIIAKKIGFTILGIALGGGLSAFFAIPAFLQQNLVNSSSLNAGYLDFHNHFACLLQLIWSNWGFGTSIQGCADNISFQLGIVNWLVLIVAISILSILIYLKKQNKNNLETLFWIIIAFFGMYMTLSYSQAFWEGVPYVSFLQFPWRFLAVAIFAISVLGGLMFTYIDNKKQKLGLFVILIIAIPALTFSYLKPATYLQKEYFAQDSPDFYKGLTQVQQNDTAELGYMPKYAKVLPDAQTVSTLEIKTLDIDAKIAVVKNTFTDKEWVVIVPKKTRAVLYIHFFPGWKFSVNGQEVKPDYSNIYGFPYINLPAGQNKVRAFFTNTTIVTVSNLITLFSFIALIVLMASTLRKINLKTKLPTSREEI